MEGEVGIFLKFYLKMKKMNKKADISILLLVVMALVLTGAALFSFNVNLKNFSAEIINIRYLDSVYIRESEITLYIDLFIDNSIEKGITREKFIDNFKKELANYKDETGKYFIEEFEDIEKEVDKEGVVKIENNKLILDLKGILIIKKFEGLSITYVYDKTFEKDL